MMSLHEAEQRYITSNNCIFYWVEMVRLNGVNGGPVQG